MIFSADGAAFGGRADPLSSPADQQLLRILRSFAMWFWSAPEPPAPRTTGPFGSPKRNTHDGTPKGGPRHRRSRWSGVQ